MLTRRRVLVGLAAAASAAAADAFLIEPARVSITRHRIKSPGAGTNDPVMRVVQITDLHLQRVDGHARRIAERVNRLKPDLVLMTGDMIDRRDRMAELGRFLSLLDDGPMRYASLGNWEHWSGCDLDQLSSNYTRHGCRLLVNETVTLRYKHRDVTITGMDDATGGSPDLTRAFAGVQSAPNHLVMAHSPVFRDVLVAALSRGTATSHSERTIEPAHSSIACVLSGHTHGGQVTLFGWPPFLPPGSGRYVRGWYTDATPNLYVSRGLGTSFLRVRFCAPPELAVFSWQLAGAGAR